jgi:hypothetical protein
MENHEGIPIQGPEITEKILTSRDFLDLALESLTEQVVPKADEMVKAIESVPLNEGDFEKIVSSSTLQLRDDLPKVAAVCRQALAGESVKIIERPAGSFFDIGPHYDQTERPPETVVERHFSSDEDTEIVTLFHRTLENRTRQDASIVSGFASFLISSYPLSEEQFKEVSSKSLDINRYTQIIENQAKNVLAGRPVKISSIQGKDRLSLT